MANKEDRVHSVSGSYAGTGESFAVNDDKLGITGLKTDTKTSEPETRKITYQRRSAKVSNKLRIGIFFVLLATLVGVFINYHGIVDSSKVISFFTSLWKEDILPGTGGKVQAETDEKLSTVSRKSPQKSASLSQTNKTTFPRNPLVVKKPLKRLTHIQKKESSHKKVAPDKKIVPDKKVASHKKVAPDKKVVPHKKVASHKKVVPDKKVASRKKERFPVERAASYPYSIYLGSYGSLERARKAISLYRKKGFSPYWVKLDLGDKGVWFRIFTGYFQDKKQAEAYIKEKQIPEAKPKRAKYANLIGIYKSPEELNRKRRVLLDLGYAPYVIDGSDGESLLYTGAFYQKARAHKQRAELASKGIQNQVVER